MFIKRKKNNNKNERGSIFSERTVHSQIYKEM